MENRLDVGAELIDVAVEREFTGRLMDSDYGSVGFHADNVFRAERSLVHTAGADPHIALVVEDGEISAGGGGHSVAVKAFHNKGDEVTRVHHIKIHD